MNLRTITLSIFIAHILILATICWAWYDMITSPLSDGLTSLFLLVGAGYYFSMTVLSYLLVKTKDRKHLIFRIALIVAFSGTPLVLLFMF